MIPIRSPLAGNLPDTAGARLCRSHCRRLRQGRPPVAPRPSAEATALCLTFCRGFAHLNPMRAASRPRKGAH